MGHGCHRLDGFKRIFLIGNGFEKEFFSLRKKSEQFPALLHE